MFQNTFPDDALMAQQTARMLLDIGAVHFNAAEPFTHASGKKAPTYVDCRKLISFPRIRTTLMDFLAVTVMRGGKEKSIGLTLTERPDQSDSKVGRRGRRPSERGTSPDASGLSLSRLSPSLARQLRYSGPGRVDQP